MDGLDEFEKALAAEKAERELSEKADEERKRKKHRHYRDEKEADRHRHRSHRHRDQDSENAEKHRSRRHRDGDDNAGHRSHRHRDEDPHRSRRHREDEDDDDDDRRHKRSRQSKDDEGRKEIRSSRHHSSREEHRTSKHDEETQKVTEKDGKNKPELRRDSWMTAPSGLDVSFFNRRDKEPAQPPPKQEPERVLHKRELNQGLYDYKYEDAGSDVVREIKVDYKFGDDGSQWRMMKLDSVYNTAKSDGVPVEEIALKRYGNLQEFDIAREEKDELDRRKLYGPGYSGKEKPTGDHYRERMAKTGPPRIQSKWPGDSGSDSDDELPVAPAPTSLQTPEVDQTTLNRLKAQMMKAKLRKAPDAAKLEEEYNQAMASYGNGPKTVALSLKDSRMLAGTRGEVKAVETTRGRERGQVEGNNDMTIAQMLQEERRTRGQTGGEGMRLAERIAKDSRFDNDLEYMDENAEKLAKRVHKSEVNLKGLAVNEFQKMNKILDSCPLCYHDDTGKPPIAAVVSLATRAYLTLPTEPEVSDGGAVIVPLAHHNNLLECDDDEWEEIRNFMKSLTRMYHEQGRDVIFYENAAAPHRHPHAAMMVVPIPYEEGETIPAYFKEAFLSADEEWSQHRKVIDTGAKAKQGMGKSAFRRSIAKEAPYFHVWFTLDGGLGHVVENSDKWPRGDLFAREVIGGMLDIGPEIIKKQGRWRKGDTRVEGFKKRWTKFDWTKLLEG